MSWMHEPVLRLIYDADADAAYISLQPADAMQGSVATTMTASVSINLDLDGDNRLVGVEILGARSNLHPAILQQGAVRSEDWRLLSNALNEILHGPDAIDDWEFQTRTGSTRADALALLKRLHGSNPLLSGGRPARCLAAVVRSSAARAILIGPLIRRGEKDPALRIGSPMTLGSLRAALAVTLKSWRRSEASALPSPRRD